MFDLTGKWVEKESEIFAVVAGLGPDLVKTVLTYHLVGAKIAASDALAANGAQLETLQGGKIGVYVSSEALSLIFLQDLDPNSPDPSTVFSKYNYGGALANGFIHGISAVLRPADL